ncbi:MAG: cyclic nucleotide-binding domain-containing protein [Planctomycetes bacterium]|nr:cyclic nucleotide-binding domain-containing protein [Planctomycetota bacterium]
MEVQVGGKKVAELGKGSYFGEIALIQKCLRTASIVTNRRSVLYSLDQGDFESFFAQGRGAQVLQNISLKRTEESSGGE